MSGQRQDKTRTRDLFEALAREDDAGRRADLLRQWSEAVRADNAKAVADSGGLRLVSRHRSDQIRSLRRNVNWLWFIVGLNSFALLVLEMRS